MKVLKDTINPIAMQYTYLSVLRIHKMQIEKRAYERLPLVKNAYAALKHGTYRVGKIQNISMKGLMFNYIGLSVPADTTAEVDLFIPGDSFYLTNLSCKVVYSLTRKTRKKTLSLAPFICGLSLGALGKQQKKNLEDFINRSTK